MTKIKKIIVILVIGIFTDCSHLTHFYIIQNGDFGKNLDYWGVRGKVAFNENIFLTEGKSLLINTALDNYAYVFQSFPYPVIELTADIWIYPASEVYEQMIQLLSNWPSDSVNFIVSVGFRTESFSCRSLDSLSIIPPALQLNSWNHISIKTLSDGEIQIFVNDELKLSFLNPKPIPIEVIMVGDISRIKNYGVVYYDKISVKRANPLNN